jgi:hypothetical protein
MIAHRMVVACMFAIPSLVAALACSGEFGSCEERRNCPASEVPASGGQAPITPPASGGSSGKNTTGGSANEQPVEGEARWDFGVWDNATFGP